MSTSPPPQTETPRNAKVLRRRLRIEAGAMSEWDRLPPILVYAIAWHGRRDRSFSRILDASGLSESTFLRILRAPSWKSIKAGSMSDFCRACQVDILCPGQEIRYILAARHNPNSFAHLSQVQKRRYARAMAEVVRGQRAAVKGVSGSPEPQT